MTQFFVLLLSVFSFQTFAAPSTDCAFGEQKFLYESAVTVNGVITYSNLKYCSHGEVVRLLYSILMDNGGDARDGSAFMDLYYTGACLALGHKSYNALTAKKLAELKPERLLKINDQGKAVSIETYYTSTKDRAGDTEIAAIDSMSCNL